MGRKELRCSEGKGDPVQPPTLVSVTLVGESLHPRASSLGFLFVMPLSTIRSTDLAKSGLWTRSTDALRELVRNASSQAPSQTYGVRNFRGGLSTPEKCGPPIAWCLRSP